MLVALSVLMMSPGAWDDPAPKGRWAASTAQLAAELLPPEMAKDAVSHALGIPFSPSGVPSSVRFHGRATSTGDGFCVRKIYHVSLHWKSDAAAAEPQAVYPSDQIRLGGCEGDFAGFNGTASLEEAKQTLRWLAWARDQAAGAAPLPFAVECRDETIDADRCKLGARHALTMLPLEKTFILEKDRDRPHVWRVAVAESRPGQLYWDVAVDGTPKKARIALAWKVPAPF